MKPRNEEQKLIEGQNEAKKPRFKIEKLEERIAPRCKRYSNPCYGAGPHCHYNPQGKLVGPC